jgi:hypothetical protein
VFRRVPLRVLILRRAALRLRAIAFRAQYSSVSNPKDCCTSSPALWPV